MAESHAGRVAHFETLRAVVAATGGTEVKSLGDGLMVAFSSPSQALACAVGIQQAVSARSPHQQDRGLVRIGIATGEAVEEDGDYFGLPVIEAARLCSAATGGQILATDLVRLFVGRNASFELRPLGPMVLKGLPDPVEVVEVGWVSAGATAANRWPMPERLVTGVQDSPFGFFGRTDRKAELDEIAKAALSDSKMRLALISGEPGVGKSTLAAQWAHAAHERGFNVCFGACEDGLPAPYAPWIGALRHAVEHSGPAIVEGLSPLHRQALAPLLPASSLIDAPETVDAENDLFLLYEASTSLLARATEDVPAVVILDDLHWTDTGSLQLLRHLVMSDRPMALVVIGTYRDTDVGRTHPLRPLIADLHREHSVTRLPLSGLTDLDLVALMESAAGHDLDDEGVQVAHALRRETDGNPFFVTEMLRHLVESGEIYEDHRNRYVLRSPFSELDLPNGVREVVSRRVADLGEDADRLLRVAAVIGREFDIDLLARVGDRTEDDVLDALEGAVAAAILVESATTSGRFRFAHAIIQHTLYQDFGATRRQRLHLQVAQALEGLRGDEDAHVPELALHWMAATRPTDSERAVHYALRAAELALAAVAPGDAVDWYGRALELIPESDERLRARTLVGVGSAQRLAGDPAYRETLLEAAHLADRAGDASTLVDAVLINATGNSQMTEGDREREAVARAALARLEPGPSTARARVLATLAELTDSRDLESRLALSNEAIETARSCEDPATTVAVYCQTYASLALPELLDERRRMMDEAIMLADRLGQPAARFDTRFNRMHVAVEVADLATYNRLFTELTRIADETAFPYQQWQLRLVEAGRLLLAGDLDAAEVATQAALEYGTRHGVPLALAVFGGQFAEVRVEQGRAEEIAGLLDEMAKDPSALNLVKVSAAFMSLQVGAVEEARRAYDEVLTTPIGDVLPRDAAWSIGLARFADVVVELGERDAAHKLLEVLEPIAHLVATPNAVINLGSMSRPVGRLAHLLGMHDRAERHLWRAVEVNTRLDAPFHAALTMIELAELLRDRGTQADLEDAREHLLRAREISEERHFRGLLDRIGRLDI